MAFDFGDVLSAIFSPKNIGQAALVAQGAGAVVAAYGAYESAQAQRDALQMQAEVARVNQNLAGVQAANRITQGQTESARVALAGAKLKSSQIASMAGRGLDLSEGSPLRLLEDTDLMTGVDVSTAADNAAREAEAIRMQATNYGRNADLYSRAASNTSPWKRAGGSLLTSSGVVAKSWYDLSSKGAL